VIMSFGARSVLRSGVGTIFDSKKIQVMAPGIQGRLSDFIKSALGIAK